MQMIFFSIVIFCSIIIHPKKPVVVTASDDSTWRMWGLPAGDLIMTGEGHKDWVSGLDFHPKLVLNTAGILKFFHFISRAAVLWSAD
jgi:WD40 repeat protein